MKTQFNTRGVKTLRVKLVKGLFLGRSLFAMLPGPKGNPLLIGGRDLSHIPNLWSVGHSPPLELLCAGHSIICGLRYRTVNRVVCGQRRIEPPSERVPAGGRCV